MQYTEKVMDHFMNPHNVGVIENPSGYGKVGNPSCGDIMEIFIKVENDIITDVKFRTFGTHKMPSLPEPDSLQQKLLRVCSSCSPACCLNFPPALLT